MIKTIWQHEDVDAIIYEDDGAGVRVNPSIPLLTYCYLQDTSLRSITPSERLEVWGRPKKKIVLGTEEYEFEVGHFYFEKNPEINLETIFHREKRLQIDLVFRAATRYEIHTLKIVAAVGFTISTQTQKEAQGTIRFEAEEYEQSPVT